MKTSRHERKLVFENGKVFLGRSFGGNFDKGSYSIFEVVFNTSMVGYQEIISDASYFGQAVCMTYPLIGNYGIIKNDFESEFEVPHISALIVSEVCLYPFNSASFENLENFMCKFNVPGIFDVDTRKITRMLKDEGSMRAILTDANINDYEAVNLIKSFPIVKNHVSNVSCKNIKRFFCNENTEKVFKVVLIDCGVKTNIIRELSKRNCDVISVPYDTDYVSILNMNPDGVLVSNGPGDPIDNFSTISTIKNLRGKVPVFGICLGHQMIALALGGTTYKLRFGHRGGNHPVKDLTDGKIRVTSQNHSYAVDPDSLKNFKLTHINLLDNTIEGIEDKKNFMFSIQFHPEGSPGPRDNLYLFDKFLLNMKIFKKRFSLSRVYNAKK
ncbi:MAG: carbamoyl phosphate synthase small subunit [Candidatus Improbicoccus pseudotrichonymphae]|uniref:Carbamoyl phosphate synthase small chain n=1 Tax=Candidatus Improbicoccus pseudotrichonymphae TaxID=3033792 RepID=A0AA48I1D7_9FIRM|nr:MAG: carbamoyl phosphate synthase small subunit [Candidatus Improbicoccus pseudotrichonymphae]